MRRFVPIFFASLLLSTTDVFACKPVPYPDFSAETQDADIVFKGKVLSIEKSAAPTPDNPAGEHKARIQILEVRKGQLGNEIVIEYVPRLGGNCGMPLQVDEEPWFQTWVNSGGALKNTLRVRRSPD